MSVFCQDMSGDMSGLDFVLQLLGADYQLCAFIVRDMSVICQD